MTKIVCDRCGVEVLEPFKIQLRDLSDVLQLYDLCGGCLQVLLQQMAPPHARRPTIDFSAPIHELRGLSTRARRILWNAELRTVGQLVQKSAGKLLCLRAFGKGCLCDVEDALAQHGLKLARIDGKLEV